ncbi:hypothetical protein FLAG1_06057 [Fusarium langsethiae]|uniref:Uncharacterized protein n=1 Tax=Fusarium langsethiae TaxID=179993 RepID=A0A0M9EWJ7_FUSLA|nr:hypothetical protein FLAG1_06057 [Fusarium langsethiae]GKU00114.1 unnamed protein product [Fusarium langsethiae]GKU18487.1 unnamed protein product [Fusarium langsethiae]
MSYSSQRYDLDAAAARKRSHSSSRSRDHRYNDQPCRSHAHDDYYRAPTVSLAASYAKREDRSYMRREERNRYPRETRTNEEGRSCADRKGRGCRSSSHREAPSSMEGRRDGRPSEPSQSTRDAHAKRQSRCGTERREHVHSDAGRSGKRASLRRESQDGHGTRSHSKREDTSHREGEYSRSTPEEINTFLKSGRASKPSWGSSTYGTYVFPLESRGQYRSMDPTKCTCKCCPHPIGTAHSHDHHQNQGPGMSSKRAAGGSRPGSKRTAEGRYLIQVVDKSRSALNRENGPSYPISLNPSASCDRIASFLAPEKRYAKVLVHWDDGRVQRLDNNISMKDLILHAEFLQVRETKSVHWAA